MSNPITQAWEDRNKPANIVTVKVRVIDGQQAEIHKAAEIMRLRG